MITEREKEINSVIYILKEMLKMNELTLFIQRKDNICYLAIRDDKTNKEYAITNEVKIR